MKSIKVISALLAFGALSSGAFAQQIRIDGSSTVYPIALAAAEEFSIDNPEVKTTVAFSGTGGGFKKFCIGETDISNASRPIKESEMAECAKNGIEFIELPIAYDGLTVVVNPKNTWASCLTVAELKKMWEPGSKVQTWQDVNPAWPNKAIKFFGAGSDSGTFDYFTEEINGKQKAIRTDYFPSEDDNVLVKGVEGNEGAIGFMGYAYYLDEGKKLKAIAVDKKANGKCVLPNAKTISSNTYSPLSRPLFMYVSKPKMAKNKAIKDFLKFVLAKSSHKIIGSTGYIVLPETAYTFARNRLNKGTSGTVFGLKANDGKTVMQVLSGR